MRLYKVVWRNVWETRQFEELPGNELPFVVTASQQMPQISTSEKFIEENILVSVDS